MKIIQIYQIITIITTFTACHTDRRLDVMEQAGANRAELEKVLHHYQDDELKLQAAKFLLANMDVHYTEESPAIYRFRQGVDSLTRIIPTRVKPSIAVHTMCCFGSIIGMRKNRPGATMRNA